MIVSLLLRAARQAPRPHLCRDSGPPGLLMRLCLGAVMLGLALGAAGCRDETTAATPGTAPATAATTVRRPPPQVRGVVGVDDAHELAPEEEIDHEAACAPQGSDVKPMQLLGFSWTSGVERRDPKDKLHAVKPGQRVYTHLRLRNRSGRERCVRVKFRINGKPRPAIPLKIGKSWSWRTWAYSTPRSDDRGHIEVTVTDDQGHVLVKDRLLIRK